MGGLAEWSAWGLLMLLAQRISGKQAEHLGA